jgi:hypothetical protein
VVFTRWLLLVLGLAAVGSAAAFESRVHFKVDRTVASAAARQAQDMVQFAAVELSLRLDWSDGSIAAIEDVAAELHADLRRERAGLRDVDTLLRMLGSYVGEVYRRNHGGEWGYVVAKGQRILAVRGREGELLWPVERVRRRVRGGGERNLYTYYQSRVALIAGS